MIANGSGIRTREPRRISSTETAPSPHVCGPDRVVSTTHQCRAINSLQVTRS